MTEDAFPVTIFHNPGCGTSRSTLAMIQAAGHAPQVVDYVKAGWSRDQLKSLAAEAGAPLRDFIRERGTPAAELGLLEPGVSDDVILDAMVAHPIIVNRPIVRTPKGVRLCRPAERVQDLL